MTRRLGQCVSAMLFFAVLLAWALVLPRLRLTTAITHFLPDADDKSIAALSRSLAESSITSTLTLDISNAPEDALVRIATELTQRLASDPRTRWARSGLDEGSVERVVTLFSGREVALVPEGDLSDDGIRARVSALRDTLASPLGPVVRALAPRDPLGGFAGALSALRETQGPQLTSTRGALLGEDGSHAFVFAATHAKAFDAPRQARYLAFVHEVARASMLAAGAPEARLEIGGVARYAIASEAQIRGDIERIGSISTLGILLLFAIVFRSGRMLGLGLVPLFFGSALATLASHFVFGEIHGLTIAFGTSLLGVGIDYAEHYFTHFALAPEAGAYPVMRRVWPGLWLGALTTIIGFAGLAFTTFPGVREIAFFSAVAVLGALVGTKVLLPPWMPLAYSAPRFSSRLVTLAESALFRLQRSRTLAWGPVVLAIVAIFSATRARFVDDLSALLAVDPDVAAEDERVRARVTNATPGLFAVVVDPDDAHALEKLDRTTAALRRAKSSGLVQSFAPLGAWLRSPAAQARSFVAAKSKRESIRTALDQAGFQPEAFAPFWESLDAPEPQPVTLRDLRGTPVGPLLEALAPRLPEGQAYVMPTGGARDVAELRALLGDAIVLDEPAMLRSTYGRVRKETIRMLAVGVGLVLLTLMLRYRSAKLAVAALAPAVLAATCTVGIFAAAGTELTLLHVVALLLVLSMGADFGIFVVEGRATTRETADALVSILTATTTTLLSFGLLALSRSPALRALGTTITVGLTLSFLFCPSAWILLRLGGRPQREAT